MSVKIVVDSTVDLPPAAKEQVRVVPLSVLFGEAEYKDGVTITAEKFYEMLETCEQLPTTSQPTPASFEETYRELVEAGHEVVVITISSKLSGTYQSATIAADEFPGKVFVVDSRSATIAAGVLAEYALQLADAGMSGEQILNELMEVRKHVHLCAIVDTLEYLKKGGRLSPTVAFVGGVLNLKPLISVEEGVINTLGKARGSKAAYTMLTKECANYGGIDHSRPVMLGYTGNCDEQLVKYIQTNEEVQPYADRAAVIGATIGVHAGPGAVAVAFFSKE